VYGIGHEIDDDLVDLRGIAEHRRGERAERIEFLRMMELVLQRATLRIGLAHLGNVPERHEEIARGGLLHRPSWPRQSLISGEPNARDVDCRR